MTGLSLEAQVDLLAKRVADLERENADLRRARVGDDMMAEDASTERRAGREALEEIAALPDGATLADARAIAERGRRESGLGGYHDYRRRNGIETVFRADGGRRLLAPGERP